MQLKEPESLINALLASLPLAFINLLLTIGILSLFKPLTASDFGFSQEGFSMTVSFGTILGLLMLLVFHELLHLIVIPGFASSERTHIGITYMGGFVHTEEEIPKARYILITVLPFITISVLLPFVLGSAGLLTPTAKDLILLNSMASSVDILTMITVSIQAPTGSILTSNGTRTYWKQQQQPTYVAD